MYIGFTKRSLINADDQRTDLQIISLKEFTELNADDGVDWAIEMIRLGHDCSSLYMLASFSKPTNYFEVINYIEIAVNDLGLSMLRGTEAITSYRYYHVLQIAKGINIREHLTSLYRFSLQTLSEEHIDNFYLLFWAWDDFDYGNEFSPYWEIATKENIEQIIVNEANQWLRVNKSILI